MRDDEAISRVFTNLTPFIPLSFKGEGKRFIERGETPLLPALPFPCQGKGSGDGLLNNPNLFVILQRKGVINKITVIISASRRTDIPALYSQWFMNRIRAGWCLVPNPVNPGQVSHVSLKPEDVDAIVFWSKNPAPMLAHLEELDNSGFRYYFQFTLNDYPEALEPNIPSLDDRITTFLKLSEHLEPQRVIWRYDPIILSNITNIDFHREKFATIAGRLAGATRRVMLSIVHFYKKTDRRLSKLEQDGVSFDKEAISSPHIAYIIRDLASIAKQHNMESFTCASERDFTEFGMPPGRCVDGGLLHQLWGLPDHYPKDPYQRKHCRCSVSKDIGINDTCIQGCPYCYSTRNNDIAQRRYREHDPASPIMWQQVRTTW